MTSNNKIALVTGANRGLGLAAAVRLTELGYFTIFAGRNTDALHLAMEYIK